MSSKSEVSLSQTQAPSKPSQEQVSKAQAEALRQRRAQIAAYI